MKALGLAPEDLRGMVDDIWGSLFDPPPIDEELPLGRDALTAYVDISGGWTGRVHVSTSAAGAIALTAHMLDLPPDEVGLADLADAIGELANIVGGSVKACIVGASSLSLPHVGATAPSAAEPDALEVNATWNDHPLCVRVCARHNPLIPSRRLP
ncbi:MAG: chemotaxis protein CheX [Sporichthyaceae bacterium]